MRGDDIGGMGEDNTGDRGGGRENRGASGDKTEGVRAENIGEKRRENKEE